MPLLLVVILALAPALSSAAGQEPSLEERRMAVMPQDLGLEPPPIRGPDGREWKQVHPVRWNAAGTRVAYVGYKAGRNHPVIGETMYEGYHYVSGPTFARRGDLVVFRVGMRTGKETESWWVLPEGEKIGQEDWIGEIGVSDDGSRLAYWIQPGAKVTAEGPYTQGRQILVVGTRTGEKWAFKKGDRWEDASSLEPPLFSADGVVILSRVAKGGLWFALTSTGKKEELSPKGGLSFLHDMALSASGKRIAFSTGEGPAGMPDGDRRARIVVGKEEYGQGFEDVGMPVFTPDGEHVVFKFAKGSGLGLALDGQGEASETWDFVHTPVFSTDSRQMAFVTNEGGQLERAFRLLPTGEYTLTGGRDTLRVRRLDGRTSTMVGTSHLEIRDPIFSASGELLAYRARDEDGWRIYAGEAKSEPYDEVGPPHFSGDGKKVAFGARSGRELWWRVLALP